MGYMDDREAAYKENDERNRMLGSKLTTKEIAEKFKDLPGIGDYAQIRQLAQGYLELGRELDPYFDKPKWDEKRGGKNASGQSNDPCANCGHQYYRHFDWMDGNAHVGCKYCPCTTFHGLVDVYEEIKAEGKKRKGV